jgi:hypothetical protein
MNKLTKIALGSAACGLAFCAVLISPVILVYGVPFAIGIVSDIVQLSGGPIIPVDLIASPVAYLMLRREPAPAAV